MFFANILDLCTFSKYHHWHTTGKVTCPPRRDNTFRFQERLPSPRSQMQIMNQKSRQWFFDLFLIFCLITGSISKEKLHRFPQNSVQSHFPNQIRSGLSLWIATPPTIENFKRDIPNANSNRRVSSNTTAQNHEQHRIKRVSGSRWLVETPHHQSKSSRPSYDVISHKNVSKYHRAKPV